MSSPPTPPSYEGYAAMARFMDSSGGVGIFRRFGELQIRNLLNIQCQISDLERRIHDRDLRPNVEHGSLRCDEDAIRRTLMKRLRQLLREYSQFFGDLTNLSMLTLHIDDAVLAAAAVNRLSRPNSRATSVMKHFVETLRPLVDDEEPDLENEDDLISFKVYDDSQFPLWVTETLHLGDWTSTTRMDVGRQKLRCYRVTIAD
jgi:hypothetical protein